MSTQLNFRTASDSAVLAHANIMAWQAQVWETSRSTATRERVAGALREYLVNAEQLLAQGQPPGVSVETMAALEASVAGARSILGGGGNGGGVVGAATSVLPGLLGLAALGAVGFFGFRWLKGRKKGKRRSKRKTKR